MQALFALEQAVLLSVGRTAMCQASCRLNFQVCGGECGASPEVATAASTTLSRSGLNVFSDMTLFFKVN